MPKLRSQKRSDEQIFPGALWRATGAPLAPRFLYMEVVDIFGSYNVCTFKECHVFMTCRLYLTHLASWRRRLDACAFPLDLRLAQIGKFEGRHLLTKDSVSTTYSFSLY